MDGAKVSDADEIARLDELHKLHFGGEKKQHDDEV